MLDWWIFNVFGTGIGAWFFFLLLDVGLISWLIFDSQGRPKPIAGWRIAIIVSALCILPAPIVYYYASSASAILSGASLRALSSLEALAWLGIVVGAAVPIGIVVAYLIMVVNAPVPPPPPIPGPRLPPPTPTKTKPRRDEANGSLVVIEGRLTGREYRLARGDTRIGRKEGNDIALPTDDLDASKEHALIREENGYFTLYDRGSTNGTLVNGFKVTGPVLLQNGDIVEMGETKVRFVVLM